MWKRTRKKRNRRGIKMKMTKKNREWKKRMRNEGKEKEDGIG